MSKHVWNWTIVFLLPILTTANPTKPRKAKEQFRSNGQLQQLCQFEITRANHQEKSKCHLSRSCKAMGPFKLLTLAATAKHIQFSETFRRFVDIEPKVPASKYLASFL